MKEGEVKGLSIGASKKKDRRIDSARDRIEKRDRGTQIKEIVSLHLKSIFFITVVFSLLATSTKSQTLFRWPLQASDNYSEVNDFYIINNYVDQDNTSMIRDWNCGRRTYNGHRGIDIDIWPFTWSMMNNNNVMVVAAAPGRIVAAIDNNNNESNCAQPGQNTNWNYIAIRHNDSSTSLYGHIRDNSALVTVGQMVTDGQPLAFVGSSGSSSNPHLHFEVNSMAVDNSQAAGVVDPYSGTCNILNAVAWWQSQKTYFEPAIIRVMTHGSMPFLSGSFNTDIGFCPSGEIKNAKAAFVPNDSVYLGVGMRDFLQSLNHSFNLKVYYPNGTIWIDENRSSNLDSSIRRVYYTFDKKLPGSAPSGTYKVQVSFNGTTGVFFFTVNCPSSQMVAGTLTGTNGFKSSSLLTSTAFIPSGSRMLLQAADRITLSPGFVAQNGSRLKARIRECNYVE